MLAKKYRLSSSKEIEKVKKKGKTYKSDSFTLKFLDRGDDDPPRTAFIISTKISKNASLRNRAKRSVSEAIRHNLYSMNNGYDIVVIAHPGIIKVYTQDLMREVQQALAKSKLSK